MSEADRYTTEMWKQHLARVSLWVVAREPKRNAFARGFNGEPVSAVHHTTRAAWADGRHSAILLGHIVSNEPAQTGEGSTTDG